jgi:hypothetical protein
LRAIARAALGGCDLRVIGAGAHQHPTRRSAGGPQARIEDTPPQPLGVVKVGFQPSDGSSPAPLTPAKKTPALTAGLKLNEVERMKGTDWLKVRPVTLVPGSLVDRKAGARA